VSGLQILEIRTYRLRAGTRDTFHLLATESIGALSRYGFTVVDYGPSIVDDNGHVDYHLIRAYATLADRDRLEAAFYGAREWRERWRDAILACIESYHTVVMTVTPEAVDALTARGSQAP
jgi:hypothetical protein